MSCMYVFTLRIVLSQCLLEIWHLFEAGIYSRPGVYYNTGTPGIY